MKCWKCGKECEDFAVNCPDCGVSLSRETPKTEIGRAMRKLYDKYGAEKVLTNSAYLVNGLGDLTDGTKKVRDQLNMAMNAGLGKMYLDQVHMGEPDASFNERVHKLLTEEAGLSDKVADELAGYFDEMIGWYGAKQKTKEIVRKKQKENSYEEPQNQKRGVKGLLIVALCAAVIGVLVLTNQKKDDPPEESETPAESTMTGEADETAAGEEPASYSGTNEEDNENPTDRNTEEPAGNSDNTTPLTDIVPKDALLIDGNYYKVYHLDEIDTWQKAQQYCIEQGGHLAVITSEELNDALYKLCRSQGYKTAFFGFSDAGSEGEWLWVTPAQPAYRNWGVSEPNSGSDEEDFAMFSTSEHNGKWNDSKFGYETKAFICQWGDEGVEDSKIEVKIPDDALVYKGHSYYLFDNGKKSWAEAEQYCRSLGGYMAIINNSDENETLYNYITKDKGKKVAFFGYSDKEEEGKWRWYGDDKSTFEGWGVSKVTGVQQPNNDHVYSDYAQFNDTITNGHWNDARFGDYSYAYICEWNTVKN